MFSAPTWSGYKCVTRGKGKIWNYRNNDSILVTRICCMSKRRKSYQNLHNKTSWWFFVMLSQSKPFLTSLWYLNTTDMLFSTLCLSMQFSSNVQGLDKSLQGPHSRYIRYVGIWDTSHFSCMFSFGCRLGTCRGRSYTGVRAAVGILNHNPARHHFSSIQIFFLHESAEYCKCLVQAVQIYQVWSWEASYTRHEAKISLYSAFLKYFSWPSFTKWLIDVLLKNNTSLIHCRQN